MENKADNVSFNSALDRKRNADNISIPKNGDYIVMSVSAVTG
jgi:hypothetical protein